MLTAAAPALGTADAQSAGAQLSSAQSANASAPDCSFPITKTDASGHEVTIKQEPQRIVTLNPSAAQTLWEIGGKSKVVGVSQFAGFLDGADSRTVVTSGFPSKVQIEEVIKLKPDLVLAPNTITNETVKQIRDAGIPVYRFAMANSIQDIYQKTRVIGRLTGECQGAKQVVANMKDVVQTVENAVSGEPKPDVFYYMSSSFTAGPNTFIGKILAKAGGHNIAAEANASRPYFKISPEVVANQDPKYVVIGVSPSKLDKNPRSFIPKDSVVRNTTAWEENNIVLVNGNYISQPAPRIVQPLKKLAKTFHPEAYRNAIQTTTTTTTTEATATTTDATTTTTTGESGGSTPGFGVAAGALAVLAAALLARR